MPKRKAKNEDPEDLQSFLNDIHKETEGSSDDKVVDTILKAISAEDGDLDEHDDEEAAGSKQEEHQKEEEDAAEEDEEEEDDDDDDDKYFIDDEGNCYIKTTPRKQKELQKKLKQAAVKPGRPVRSVVSKATNKCGYPLIYTSVNLITYLILLLSHQSASGQIATKSRHIEGTTSAQGEYRSSCPGSGDQVEAERAASSTGTSSKSTRHQG